MGFNAAVVDPYLPIRLREDTVVKDVIGTTGLRKEWEVAERW